MSVVVRAASRREVYLVGKSSLSFPFPIPLYPLPHSPLPFTPFPFTLYPFPLFGKDRQVEHLKKLPYN
ncbi:hypothetical protein FD723_13345 [Nostoc sp. C052]|nr:hypothetical protein FD723_13345 [Nostoc sp. C052]